VISISETKPRIDEITYYGGTMKRTLFYLLIICLLVGLSACGSSANNNEVSPAQDTQDEEDSHDHLDLFPYLGIWFSPDRSSQLVITDAYFYYHDFTSSREVYAEIQAVDLVENTIELRMYDIIHGGQHVGFDSPMLTVQYQVDGETLQIVLGRITLSGGDQPALYLQDQVLNP
jgi:hypothetical protein